MMYEYFIILTSVYNGSSNFEACSDFFDEYPTHEEIKKEIERLRKMFDTVYDARVEKRYHLTKRWNK